MDFFKITIRTWAVQLMTDYFSYQLVQLGCEIGNESGLTRLGEGHHTTKPDYA